MLPPPTTLSEPLWQTLLPLITTLPANFKAYQISLTNQLSSLQQTMQQLQQDNESLTASLQTSQEAVATLESKSAQLQTDLADSTASTTQIEADLKKASTDAKALERQMVVWRGIGIGASVAVGAVGIYEVGHLVLKWY